MASAGMGSLLVELVERKRKADEAKATADAAAEAAGGVTAAEVGGCMYVGMRLGVCVCHPMKEYGRRTNHNHIQYTTPHHINRRPPPPWWRR